MQPVSPLSRQVFKMQEEQQLIDAVLAGNRQAFGTLVGRYKRLVGHIVFRMVKDEQDREEIAQDVFVKVHQKLSTFQGKSKLGTWIGSIAHFACLDYLKKRRLPLTDIGEGALEIADASRQQPDALTEAGQRSAFLKAQIALLPPHYGTVLSLFHMEELEVKEIAKTLNMPEGTVKNYLFRARKMLKTNLLKQVKIEEIWN